MSVFVTYEMAQRAIELALPSIEAMMNGGIAKRKHGYLIIGTIDQDAPGPVLAASWAFGYPSEWEHPYGNIALDKYLITNEYGMSTREVHDKYPEKVGSLRTPYKGSDFDKEYGLIVAYSGADDYIDEVIAGVVLKILIGLIRREEAAQLASAETS